MEISIFKFLLTYYGICLDAKTSFSHLNAKETFPFLRTCSFNFAKNNCDMVCHGKIIYVRDTNGLLKPYFAPSKTIQDIEYIDYEDIKHDEEMECYDMLELSNMPTYKVKYLLSKYKRYYSFYRKLKKELENRGIYSNKKYKINKEITELEESEYDDKYKRRRKIKYKKP